MPAAIGVTLAERRLSPHSPAVRQLKPLARRPDLRRPTRSIDAGRAAASEPLCAASAPTTRILVDRAGMPSFCWCHPAGPPPLALLLRCRPRWSELDAAGAVVIWQCSDCSVRDV